MGNVDLKSSICRLHTQAALHDLTLVLPDEPKPLPEPWFMLSPNSENIWHKSEVWMRLPQWISNIFYWWVLKGRHLLSRKPKQYVES